MSLYIPFILAGLSYALSASLPFLVTKNTQMVIAIIIGIVTNLCWVQISRSVPESDIPLYGLAYDMMLTMAFLIIPYFFIKFNLTNTQIIGIVLALVGLYLTKR